MTKKGIVIASTAATVVVCFGIWAFLERQFIKESFQELKDDIKLRKFKDLEEFG